MLEPAVSPPRSCVMCAGEKDPGPPSPTLSWGLGWGLMELKGRRYLWHWGDNGAFRALVIADEAAKRGAVVLADGAGGLSIAGDVASIVLDPASAGAGPGQVPLDWLHYDHWDSPVKTALHGVVAGGGVAALERLRSADGPSRQSLNSLGYSLLGGGFLDEALSELEKP